LSCGRRTGAASSQDAAEAANERNEHDRRRNERHRSGAMSERPSSAADIPELAGSALAPPAGADDPVFRAPWEAQAFALTVSLHERGAFTWNEWAAELARAIRDAQARGDPDTGETYYAHWLTALERIAAAKGLVSVAALSLRKHEWEEAARRTPHGEPIVLGRN
jgi:nitrile hydratase accessory protein